MSIIEQLAQKLDVEPAKAQRLLDQFVTETRHDLQTQQQVTIPGVGEFRQTQNGVAFEADSSLTEIVNYRFAGLSNVDLSSDNDQPLEDPEVPEPAEQPELPPDPPEPNLPTDEFSSAAQSLEEAIAGGDPDPEPPAEKEPAESAPPADPEVEEEFERFWTPKEEDSALGPFPESEFEDPSYDIMDQDKTEPSEKPDDTKGTNSSETAETFEEKVEHPKEPEEPQVTEDLDQAPKTAPASSPEPADGREIPGPAFSRSQPKPPQPSPSSNKLSLVAGLLIITGATLLVYFLWFNGSPEPQRPSPAQPQVVSNTSSEQEPSEEEIAEEPPSSADAAAEEQQDVPEEPPSTPKEETPPPPFESPLQSDQGILTQHGGHTLVVASLKTQRLAQQLYQRLKQNGFRTSILPGGSGYRVAVGQFETTTQALAMREELPAAVSREAWVLDIQP